MEGADYGALLADLRDSPPLHEWLPLAIAEIMQLLGSKRRADEILNGWHFRTPTSDMSEYDAAFLAALNGR